MLQLTQNKIAFYIAFSAFLAGTIFLTIFFYLFPTMSRWLFILPFLVGIVSFISNKILVESFMYSKIKTLYNAILSVKKTENVDIKNPNLMEEIEYKVEQYTKNQAQEIETLKKMETYRREFLGNVSHELKTPIFNIQGYLETLLDGGIEDPEINYKFLKKANDNVERISKIVEDLVFISLSESGQLKLKKEVFNIFALVQKVYGDLEDETKKKQIKLSFENNIYQNIPVLADESRIYQVLHNLIQNAIKYCPSGTKVKTSFSDIGNHILVEINDNGDGIAEEHLPHLYERFYRTDHSRNRSEGGTGLGLAIVKHIIESHGQTVSVRSKVGKGTVFSFTLGKP